VRSIDFDRADDLTFLLFTQHDVLSRAQALRYHSPAAIRHRLDCGQWQRPHRAVFVTTTGVFTHEQERWIAALAAGPGALVAGLSALEQLGLRGYARSTFHLLLPAGRRYGQPPLWAQVHRTRHLPAADVHQLAAPPCTMPARSLVDAAQWARTDDEARADVAAAFQQRMVSSAEVYAVLGRMLRVRRGSLIERTVADAAGGAHSLAELAFLALSRRAGFPEPKLQRVRRDASGRKRYLDVLYEEYGVHVEIDGAQHMDVRRAWDDMRRQNEIWIAGERVLRFPAWLVRERPDEVVAQVRAALIAAGWRPDHCPGHARWASRRRA
jgi:very-short-patch-repair endonuclease